MANAAPACSAELLASFDPGLEVSARQLLPPAQHEAATQTDQVVAVPCHDEESDAACQRRAEAEVAKAFPDNERLGSDIVAEEVAWRVRLRIDGEETERSFDDVEALAAEVRRLREAGGVTVVVHVVAVPAADSPRDAVVRASGVIESRGLESLRMELVVVLPEDEAIALARLQRSAARARLVVHGWEVREDRTLRVELGCVRPLLAAP
jgi:hypothetical protein